MVSTFALLQQAACSHASRPAIIDGATRVSFSELPEQALRTAHAVVADTAPAARIVLMKHNSVDYAVLALGLEATGRIRVPVNWRSTAHELANLTDDCAAEVIVCDEHSADVVARAIAQLQAAGRPAPRAVRIEEIAETAPSPMVVSTSASSVTTGDTLASINYTSGTLAEPKGVVLSVRNWQHVYRNLLSVRDIRPGDRIGLVGPLSHAAGAYLVPSLLQGATVVLLPAATPGVLAEQITRHRLTILQCVPTVLTRATADAAFARSNFSSLRLVIYGAERMPCATLEASIALFGPVLAQNYGLTEAMMTCATLQPHEHLRSLPHGSGLRHDTIGRPYPFVEIVIRRADGSAAETGEIGELTVRSPHVMQGYWQRPEATAAVLREGWLWSGDLGLRNDEGFLELKGRRSDMVICGGINTYPSEVEAWLQRYTEFQEVVVFGVADTAWGERLVAAVVLHPAQQVGFDQIKARARTELGIRCPRQWLCLPQLPRTGNGKLDRRALCREALTA